MNRSSSASRSGAAITQPRFLEWGYQFAALLGDVRTTPRSDTNFAALIGGAGLDIKYL